MSITYRTDTDSATLAAAPPVPYRLHSAGRHRTRHIPWLRTGKPLLGTGQP